MYGLPEHLILSHEGVLIRRVSGSGHYDEVAPVYSSLLFESTTYSYLRCLL